MRTIFTLILGVILISNVGAQRALPYGNNFNDINKIFDIELYNLGQKNQSWFWANNALTNNSINDSMDSWAVTPSLDMSKGAHVDSLSYNFSSLAKYIPGDTIGLYYLEGNRDPSVATRRVLLVSYLTPALFKNDDKWYLTSGINIPSSASSGYLAFRFVSSQQGLYVNFDNLVVAEGSIQSTGIIESKKSAELSFYPNPTPGQVHFSKALSYRLINALGAEVKSEENVSEADFSELNAGVYYLITDNNTSQKLVIR